MKILYLNKKAINIDGDISIIVNCKTDDQNITKESFTFEDELLSNEDISDIIQEKLLQKGYMEFNEVIFEE